MAPSRTECIMRSPKLTLAFALGDAARWRTFLAPSGLKDMDSTAACKTSTVSTLFYPHGNQSLILLTVTWLNSSSYGSLDDEFLEGSRNPSENFKMSRIVQEIFLVSYSSDSKESVEPHRW